MVTASVVALTAAYFLVSPSGSFWPGLLARLYYLPVVLAGCRYGLRGGMLTAAAIGLAVALRAFTDPRSAAAFASAGWVEFPLYFAVGALAGLLADRRRRADRARRRAERRQTLAEMGDGIAREVRKPLAVIQRSARALAGNADSRTVELAGSVLAEADRAEQMVSELLRYARPAPLEFSRGKLSELLDDCLERLGPTVAARRIEFTRHWPDSEPEIYVDAKQLGQAFLNLLKNALDASLDGGRVVIRVEPAGRWLRVTVRDFGPGIPSDKLGRVGEPFFTTRASGIGLGLASARRIIAGHEGRLRLENAEPRGVIATVELPGSVG